jgi:hypothetical protein
MQARAFCLLVLLFGMSRLSYSAERGKGNTPPPSYTNGLPLRVHVCEDYETEIEKRWWLRGSVETTNLPRSFSPSLSNTRASRATGTNGQKAVVFNPVPGPPLGSHPRLNFRYWINGEDQLQVQIFSLTHETNRRLILTNLSRGHWETMSIDVADLRGSDAGGGPFVEGERIDDVQFYVSPKTDLLIDDIVLFEAAPETEKRPFPRRIIFTAWFDTGKQGAEWPGTFEIVSHEKPLMGKAAKSVLNSGDGKPWIRLQMRGFRRLSEVNHVRFRYFLTGAKKVTVVLANSQGGRIKTDLSDVQEGSWQEAIAIFKEDPEMPFADEMRFRVAAGAELLIDDVLLFEPGTPDKGKE